MGKIKNSFCRTLRQCCRYHRRSHKKPRGFFRKFTLLLVFQGFSPEIPRIRRREVFIWVITSPRGKKDPKQGTQEGSTTGTRGHGKRGHNRNTRTGQEDMTFWLIFGSIFDVFCSDRFFFSFFFMWVRFVFVSFFVVFPRFVCSTCLFRLWAVGEP